jgi:hypothetical protein
MRRFKSRHKETTNMGASTANHKNGVWKFGFLLYRRVDQHKLGGDRLSIAATR